MTLVVVTLSNARRFYSSMGSPLGVKVLRELSRNHAMLTHSGELLTSCTEVKFQTKYLPSLKITHMLSLLIFFLVSTKRSEVTTETLIFSCFLLESDNAARLYLSTSSRPDKKVLICQVKTNHLELMPLQFRT